MKIDVREHMGLVWFAYKKLRVTNRPHIDRAVIIEAGMAALARVAVTWAPGHASGATFATFAYKCIRNDMGRAAMVELNHWGMNQPYSKKRNPRSLFTFTSVGHAFGRGYDAAFARPHPDFSDYEFQELFDHHLKQSLHKLNKRERLIIELRAGLNSRVETYKKIGHRLGITKERVRQIEMRAYRKIREIIPTSAAAMLREAI